MQTLDDFLEQMRSVRNMGPLKNLLGMLPGVAAALENIQLPEEELIKCEAIIQSMSKVERDNPEVIDGIRCRRVAKSAGVPPEDVSRLIKRFLHARTMADRMTGKSMGSRMKMAQAMSKRDKGSQAEHSINHSFACAQLRWIIEQHIQANDLGVLVSHGRTIFDSAKGRRPEILFITKARWHLIKGRGIPLVPDLCVEIYSPASAAPGRPEAYELSASNEVPHYWIVDAEVRAFDAYELVSGKYVKKTSGRHRDVVSAQPFSSLGIPLPRLWSPLG